MKTRYVLFALLVVFIAGCTPEVADTPPSSEQPPMHGVHHGDGMHSGDMHAHMVSS